MVAFIAPLVLLAPFPITADSGIGFIVSPLARMCWKPFGVSMEARLSGAETVELPQASRKAL